MENVPNTQRIKRHSPPSKLDQLEKGTICEVVLLKEGITEYYEQCGHDRDNPDWVMIYPDTEK